MNQNSIPKGGPSKLQRGMSKGKRQKRTYKTAQEQNRIQSERTVNW